ncbi:hypothetical protein DT019_03000 [Streptomyces sp. SDr-06]|uniref:hypothetical protein n=1 Tax=Streptomyces sp. SDr-06 TaxID=2267702 RepID=UPI000DE943BC|nr:hypothetical protein [Streptomyces sp. SDr-06]RCH70471.1 hypothetical protein DT019_03000 [Streptomyces sp. SDr-06]
MRRIVLPVAAILLTAACSSSGGDSTPPSKPAGSHAFDAAGDTQCSITYQDRGDSMSWTVTTTVAGELVTHATGDQTYRHDDQIGAGHRTYTAPVPLSQVHDIGGVLHISGTQYGCSIGPQK